MLGMAKSGDMKLSKFSGIFMAVILLTGCTPTQLDMARPEINRYNGMILSPDTVASEVSEIEGAGPVDTSPGTDGELGEGGEGGDGDGGDSLGGDVVTGAVNVFDPLPYNVVSSPDYVKYLDSEIYKPISEILNSERDADAAPVYFRVFHSGYTGIPGATTQIKRASIYDNKLIDAGSSVVGTIFPFFAYDWLADARTSEANYNSVLQSRAVFQSFMDASGISDSSTWLDISSQISDGSLSVVPVVMLMWGNMRVNSETFGEFRTFVSNNVIGAIPNISLRIASSKSSATYVTLNQTSDIVGTRYYDHMTKLDVDRLFGTYNQYEARDTVLFTDVLADTQGVLFYYIDGYSKTIVALCGMDGTSLDEALGSRKDEVVDLISNVLNYTQWEELQGYVPDLVILQSGSRGIN